MGEIATVGKLEHTDTTVITCLDDILAYVDILVEEHGNHACGSHGLNHLNLVKLCHYDLSIVS